MHFVFCFADNENEWNTSQWRSLTPADGINASQEHTARCIPLSNFRLYGDAVVQDVVGRADIIVVQRNLLEQAVWDACDYWRLQGKLVVADLDDDYPHLLPQNPAFKFWIEDKASLKEQTGYTPIEALTEGFRHVDALVSPNRLILEDWAHVVPGYWLPNFADGKWYKGIEQKPLPADDEPVIVGWGGSVSHYDGFWFSGLKDAMPIITERYPRVVWKICGSDTRIKRMFRELLPADRWIDQPGVPPAEWPKQVTSFDVGLAPLCGPGSPQGERYDLRRSWLKAEEYLLCGVPWVASEGVVYKDLDGHGGFMVPNTVDAWVDGIGRVLDNLDAYKTESRELLPWARDNLLMENQVEPYIAVFRRILAERNARANANLPNVVYAAGLFDEVDEIASSSVSIGSVDLEEMLNYQRQTYDTSLNWYKALDGDTVQHGVDLAFAIQYPLLHTINAAVFEEVAK